MGQIRKTNSKGRYPRTVHIDLPQRTSTKRNVLGSALGNTATQSSVTGGVKGYGIELSDWVSHAINEGWISISGADTHAFNTNLTTSTSRTHTVSGTALWRITNSNFSQQIRFDNDEEEIFVISPYIGIGDPYGDVNGTVLYVEDENSEISLSSPTVSATINTDFVIASTTGTFRPPVMTGAQATAIGAGSPGDIVYVTSVNGVFTSVGFWGQIAGTWTALH